LLGESTDGIDGPGRPIAFELDLIAGELLYLLADQPRHRESSFSWSMSGVLLMRRFLAGNPPHFFDSGKFQCRLSDGDVSLMEGIEYPTQQCQGIHLLLAPALPAL
jgi:hypothetical protein